MEVFSFSVSVATVMRYKRMVSGGKTEVIHLFAMMLERGITAVMAFPQLRI